jgi:hypothetical protein
VKYLFEAYRISSLMRQTDNLKLDHKTLEALFIHDAQQVMEDESPYLLA